jgi:hypothetical protein
MLEWLKKIGGSKPWQNKAGLEEKAVALLAEDFSALEKLNSDLPSEIVRYLLDGEGEEVLARLAGTQGAGEILGVIRIFTGASKANTNARVRFFECVRNAPPDFFVRLGKVYEAAIRAPYSNPAFRSFQSSAFTTQPSFGDVKLNWLHTLLVTATHLSLNTWPRKCRPCQALSAELIEAMLEAEGFPKSLLVRAAFGPPLQRFGGSPLEPVFVALNGLAASALRHKQVLLEILNHSDFKQRVYALQLMKRCGVAVEPFAEMLVELAVGSSKQAREQADILLAEAKPVFIPLLKEKIIAGENDERIAAARLLWRWGEESFREFLEQRLAEEKSKKVAQAIRDLLAVPAQNIVPTADDPLRLPELPPIPAHLPLGAETERAWRECFDQINRGITHVQAANAKNHYAKDLQPVSVAAIQQSFAELAGGKCGCTLKNIAAALVFKETSAPLKTFWQRPELQQVHLVRFLIQTGGLPPDSEANDRYSLFGHWLETFVVVYHRAHPNVGLREFGAAFTAAGLNSARIGKGLLNRFGAATPYGMTREQVWPYWVEHLDLLEGAFAPASKDFMQRYYQREARAHAFDALASFPHPLPRLQPLLWDLALGPKSERSQAQQCLVSTPDKHERLIAALAAGSAETRFAAAEWLGRLDEKSAVDPLLAALKREKNEATKGVMLAALEQLGAPVEQFLDRAGLSKEAEKGLAKGVPADLNWFPFDQLPPAHWEDNGKKIDPFILRWWLVQGFKLKNPEPGALLRRYCASLKPSERETLGQFVLEAWIAEDTAPISRVEAEKLAQSHAQSMAHFAQYMYQQAQKNPQGQTTAQVPLTVEQYYAQALPKFLRQPKSSAVSSKGILSVAGACVGTAAAPVVNRYLKEWYGQRAAQCRALLQMLAWVEHRTATQLLLAVGSRFRTKSIQEEANAQAQALAERKGWTVAELADRTIPSAGLDENGVVTIDFGPRKFKATLDEDLEFALTDSEGKPLKAMPDPRKDDDEALAAEAKKNFSAAKKELKSVLAMQRDRLYEAMCTQRTWAFEDWNLYLKLHPIVKHYCQRLVWAVVRDEKAVQLFRPLPDGSLTNVTDDPVTLSENDQVRVAHECQVTPDQSQAWRQHLKDYNAEMLFEQFGRPNFNLSEENRNETEVSDFQGHILEAFKLRGRANKLGYTRGQAQDGGWFFDYHKRFPTLGIEAVIEFTGNGLPEENRTVGLTILHFDRVAVEGEPAGGDAKMMLSEVPPVLLSECWNDIRTIAAEGPGFDPAWEKKTQM